MSWPKQVQPGCLFWSCFGPSIEETWSRDDKGLQWYQPTAGEPCKVPIKTNSASETILRTTCRVNEAACQTKLHVFVMKISSSDEIKSWNSVGLVEKTSNHWPKHLPSYRSVNDSSCPARLYWIDFYRLDRQDWVGRIFAETLNHFWCFLKRFFDAARPGQWAPLWPLRAPLWLTSSNN